MTTILAFIFVLGVLVFVHELGHFLAAKRVGIRVLKFQLGFNPTIVSFRRGDTEYSIGALPLGGFVKMAGENPEDVTLDDKGQVVRRNDEFLSKSKWERFQVLIMGPAMNLILALVLTAIVLYQGVERGAFEERPAFVGVVTKGSPAERAGIRTGDLITSVDGRGVATWEQFALAIMSRPNRQIPLLITRGGETLTLNVTPEVPPDQSRFEFGSIGVLPNVHPYIRSVNSGDAGDKAGLKADDKVLTINGEPITFSGELRREITKHPEQKITMTVLRGGQEITLEATPRKNNTPGYTVPCPAAEPCLGIGIGDEITTYKPGVFEAIGRSFEDNVKYAGLIFQTIGDLITQKASPKQLMGPIAIAQVSGESAQLGWIALFSLMASISLNLGLLNLMPIPVLDGGHILIMGLEGIARRDFSMRVKEKMLLAGFVLLMMLMVTVIYNDLTRISWINRLMPWR